MKKTKLMRAALLLLVLTLITSCFVGGTFAKYVTEGDSTDSARVAKWGVVIDAEGATFAKEYATNTENVVGTIAMSVVGADKVVAPGTSGNMTAVKLSGTPEVAVSVNYAADFKVENWTVDGNFYCPLQITVRSTTIDGTSSTTIDGTTFTNKAKFEEAVKREINGSTNYAAGKDLTGVTAPSVSWAWPIEHTGASAGTGENAQTNEKDTALGNLAANDKAPTVSLTITTTVTQID